MEIENSKYGQLTEEADAWVVRLRSDRVTQSDKSRFSEWLNRSYEHQKAFDEAVETWETLGAVSFIDNICDEEEHLAQRTASPAPQTNNQSPRAINRPPVNQPNVAIWQQFYRPIPAVAAVCLIVVALVAGTKIMPHATVSPVVYQSEIGESRSVSLADGSQLELNTDTIIEVVFTDDKRHVNLVKGEAFFSVAKDSSRPFVVEFGKGSATAIGTAFNILRTRHTASVTVTEGIVDVRESAELAIPNPDPVRVIHNQQVRVGRKGISPVRMVNSNRALAWRERTIIFKDTPLTDALDELNRYLKVPAFAEEIEHLRISGTFSLSSPDETLNAIVTAFNLSHANPSSENALYLRPE